MKNHKLKTVPEPFQRIWEYRKKCELRKNDRGFKIGDELTLQEWRPTAGTEEGVYTGREIDVLVTDIVMSRPEWGLQDGYVIMSILMLTKREHDGLWGPREGRPRS